MKKVLLVASVTIIVGLGLGYASAAPETIVGTVNEKSMEIYTTKGWVNISMIGSDSKEEAIELAKEQVLNK